MNDHQKIIKIQEASALLMDIHTDIVYNEKCLLDTNSSAESFELENYLDSLKDERRYLRDRLKELKEVNNENEEVIDIAFTNIPVGKGKIVEATEDYIVVDDFRFISDD